ncbi:MAG: OmpA family protein [Negativicutes bacterium]|nr:OmpA family protein [Negativicutes bacterium]
MLVKKLILLTLCMAFFVAAVQAAPLTNFDSYSGSVDLGGWKTAATVDSLDYSGLYRFNGGLTVGVGGPWGLQYRYYDMNTKANTYSFLGGGLGLYSQHFEGTTNEFNVLYSLGKDSHVALFAGVNRVSSRLITSGFIDQTLTSNRSIFQGGLIATMPLGDSFEGYLSGGIGAHRLAQAEVGLSAKLSDDWQANVGYRWFRINHAFNENNLDVKVKGITFGVTYLFGKKEAPVVPAVQPPAALQPPAVVQPALQPPVVVQPPAQKIVLQSALFDFDKDTLQQQAYPILDNVVALARQNPDWTFLLTGNTDSRGTDAYNMDLSLRRVKTVQNYFISQGVSTNRLSIDEKGERQPVATNDTAEGRAANRRVEIHIN